MKTKENCFKNFNDVKVILNKKTNLQVMHVRDFRANSFVCKDYKINATIQSSKCQPFKRGLNTLSNDVSFAMF